jgi:hypothetical protein
MEGTFKIGKLDAARRQLDTALLLYFNHVDPVSIHTLGAAADGILRDLSTTPTLTQRGLEELPPELRTAIEKALKVPQNFLKHADRDPEEILDFAPGITELMLLDASAKYWELSGEKTPMTKAYEVWFSLQHPEYWAHTSVAEGVLEASKMFGSLNRIEVLTKTLTTFFGGLKPSSPSQGSK